MIFELRIARQHPITINPGTVTTRASGAVGLQGAGLRNHVIAKKKSIRFTPGIINFSREKFANKKASLTTQLKQVVFY